jgi:hypothetical protein
MPLRDLEQQEGFYSVLVKQPDTEAFWLDKPERKFETPAGARYAILLFLED